MKEKIDYTQLTNAELNIKIKGCEDRFYKLRDKVVDGLKELDELNSTYNECKKVLASRNIKMSNNFIKDEDEELWLKLNAQ